MFGLGMSEVLIILAIALMVIGPKKLPDLAKTLGRAMGEFKKATQDFKRSIDMEETVKHFEAPSNIIKESLREASTVLDPSELSDKKKSEASVEKNTTDKPTDKEEPSDNKADDIPTKDGVRG